MAKVTAPLLSLGARGTIGKTQTYATWKGVPYARQRVVPSNPNTSAQQETRNAFGWLQAVYKLFSATASNPWVAYAKGKPLTGRNAISRFNLAALRTAVDLSTLIFSPGNGGAPAAASAAGVGGAGTVAVTLTAPDLPAGWTINEAAAVAILDQDPQSDNSYASYTATANAAPWTCTIDVPSADNWRWGAFFSFTKPDGTIVYGPSIEGMTTST